MDREKEKEFKKQRRAHRIRTNINGTKVRPRLSVFRSLKHIYAQLINDETGRTLVSASDFDVKNKKDIKKISIAGEIGKIIAKKAKDKKITKAVFDKGSYKYHGIIKALADGAREGGLKF